MELYHIKIQQGTITHYKHLYNRLLLYHIKIQQGTITKSFASNWADFIISYQNTTGNYNDTGEGDDNNDIISNITRKYKYTWL